MSAACTLAAATACGVSSTSFAQTFNPFTFSNSKQTKIPQRERTLEDFFPKVDLPYTIPEPYDFNGLKVTGLDPKYNAALGQNLFIVVEGTPYSSLSDIYRENRLNGKSNFVTADCLVHSYFAIQNSIVRQVILDTVLPTLRPMLLSMLKQSLTDWKAAEDSDVRLDIAKNNAYLVVALKLLDTDLPLPDFGNASKLADDELKNIAAGKKAKSAIFDTDEDYAFYRPSGFYESDQRLRGFYRCRQWLSRMQFPLSETELQQDANQSAQSSRFRQSVLLFRCLDKATVDGAPAMDAWNKLCKIWGIIGARENPREHPLLPSDYKNVFRTSSQDLANVLQGLAEPFFRTKLLLSIRRNRPLELNATSIFSERKRDANSQEHAVFRLLPLVDEPELPWLSDLAQTFSAEKEASESTPFSLLELYARGSTLATNILSDICWKLDGNLFLSLPSLIEATSRKPAYSTAAPDEGSKEGRWAILSNYFKPMPETSQAVLKSEVWMRRRLLSAFAGWVDSHVALLSDKPATGASGTAPSTTASSTTAATATAGSAKAGGATAGGSVNTSNVNKTSRPAVGHYLEPAPVLYRSVREKMQQTVNDLNSINCMPSKYKDAADTLLSLCLRFEDISRKEISNQFVSSQDAYFLGNIDEVLDKMYSKLPATWHLENSTVLSKSGKQISGANLCLGRPGLIFIMLHLQRGDTLSRGAVYTYCEIAGGSLSPKHWERSLDAGTPRPPIWTSNYEVVQAPPGANDAAGGTNANAPKVELNTRTDKPNSNAGAGAEAKVQ